ncbi:hypothetical protein [Desulfospira joergensenii]|uniref:hypothetical protein n=1 Tax=Desulfospira joergensenii TaxID=53329 RepID=UPI0003B46092|nr:hypothetical protein [Desulfospira joergensenii]
MKRFKYDMSKAVRDTPAEFKLNYLEGSLIQAFGSGGGGGDSFDAAYNARMATIAEDYADLYGEDHDFYKQYYQPMEKAQIAANMELIPSETALAKAGNESALSLLPTQTELTQAQNESALSLIPGQTELAQKELEYGSAAIDAKTPVMNAFYKESLEGVDVEDRANKAAAYVSQAFDTSNAILGRSTARMGVNPNSGRYASLTTSNALDRAKAVASAKTTARTNAEDENYQRLTNAMGY